MSNEQIIWQMLDKFRGSILTQDDSLELVLQILAWAKLSIRQTIPDDLSLNKDSRPPTTKELLDQFEGLSRCDELGEDRAAFERITPSLKGVSPSAIDDAIRLALYGAENALLDNLNIPEELFISQFFRDAPFIPKEVIEVMSFLAGDLKDKTVYCPYDTLCFIARHVSARDGKPSVESPWRSPIPWLTNILADASIHTKIGDPLYNPAFTEGSILQKFDVCIAFPPINNKIDTAVTTTDLFQRFKEKTSSGPVLAIRHIIAQTSFKAVIAVQNSILFSRGAELSLREDLLQNKMIEMVISMPSALLPFTPVPFSILVLDLERTSTRVRFVDGSAEDFSTRDGRNRTTLANWKDLIETIKNGIDQAIVVDIPVEAILDNDSILETSRYLLPPEQKAIRDLFKVSNTCKLSELVEIHRPAKLLSRKEIEDSPEDKIDGVSALEVEVSNFPEYGYVSPPTREVRLVPRLTSKDEKSFLASQDILIAIKGSAGKIAIIPADASPFKAERWVASQSCLILRSRKIDPRVLFMYLTSDVGQTLLKSITSGATVPLIQLQQLKELEVVIPSEPEAVQIVKTFEEQVEIQQEIEFLKAQLYRLSKTNWSISSQAE